MSGVCFLTRCQLFNIKILVSPIFYPSILYFELEVKGRLTVHSE